MTIDELRQRTGVKDKNTLYEACASLSTPPFSALAKQTMAHGKVIWLPAGALIPALRAGYFLAETGKSLTCNEELNNNDLILETPNTESLLLLGRESGKNPDSGKNLPAPHENPDFEACYKAARACGIGDPSASQIADLRHPETRNWITPELIKAHCKALKPPKETIGLAIHRLKDWQTVPVVQAEPETQEQRGDAVLEKIAKAMGKTLEQYKEYERQKYADWEDPDSDKAE